MLGEPRDRPELRAMGLLVQAHPEPEIAGDQVELTLDVDDVGGDQQQPADLPGRGERLVLPEHLARQPGQRSPELGSGEPWPHRADRGVDRGVGPGGDQRIEGDGEVQRRWS